MVLLQIGDFTPFACEARMHAATDLKGIAKPAIGSSNMNLRRRHNPGKHAAVPNLLNRFFNDRALINCRTLIIA